MKQFYMVLVASLFLLPAVSKAGEGFTAMDLKNYCDKKDTTSQVFCTAWINGFVSGMDMATQGAGLDKTFTCFPEKFTSGQGKLIIDKYFMEHPELLHYPADQVAMVALHHDFACKEPPKPKPEAK